MSKTKLVPSKDGPPSDVEKIKIESNYLRGTIAETIAAPLTAGIPDEDNRLMKFHGSYMQDDRDVRNERQKQKLEPAYQFMVRVRAPGGVVTSDQYISMHHIAKKYGNGTLRLTTRQAFQMHGILKWNMKKSIREINDSLLDTFAACGDVNRNVMCNPNPYQSDVHGEVYEWAKKISEHLTPKTRAYHEIWLDGEKVASDSQSDKETEPIYGPVYLPRKFKIGVAVPPSNDVDVFSQDLGFIAILQDGQLQGFNVVAGGGMGMTHGDTSTYPQLGRVIGFCLPNQVVDVAEKIVTIQRDYGNRSVRKNARFKYTIDARGLEWLTDELNERLGWELQPARSFEFAHNGDRYGWVKGTNNKWHFTLFIENGRIKDRDNYKLMTGLLEIAKIHKGDFRLTANQNLLIGNIAEKDKAQVEELIKKYGLTDGKQYSALRRNAMACVALPTCGLAMAESERYLPSLLDKIEEILDEAGLREEEIVIRMSGCPNGCSRAALGEIGFIGKAPGKYNFYLGAGFSGNRLNKLYRENIGEKEILEELRPIIHHYAKERDEREHFGDFVIRAGYVKQVHSGLDFHD
ncbi:MAG TPA: assimilatory sulfite reductase (NADPH) hemoprotein subunit [Bacillus bacterium]|uniref:assimilatory sulfite reductase (NADPH) hemoprotein subunit n=1 Tax=Siminovitchia fordii TaxID=254759 RepID=UPI00036216DA|nr:assimilatory sulfite reductase (NADPH) hemoprotein subunit [Siminovitchia fordii]HBZ08307.1 assimilatory sulfite reductase (NADPH) hemoprotein subunit [Bacillus sp. (in: firmicutes)]